MSPIEIVDFLPEHQPFFEKFNKEWIEENYELEPSDFMILQHPEQAIIQQGGAILMALYEGEVAGTVALRKVDDSTYEFSKMAVDPTFRKKGIGEALSYASFEKAKELGATTVILYSNTRQAAAIRLYEKLGFTRMPLHNNIYKRANVKMKIELDEINIKTIN